MQWIYGLFLDLMSYCANALLGVMSTDLEFFEESVPIVPDLYAIFVAVGWGLLIGNCAFQSMKAMFAGLGFETESPATLLLRTGLFGVLLIFSKDVCEIGLSIGKNVIDLLGIPESVTLTMPDESYFSDMGSGSWLLVIIIGFILGFQLIKLFFEIAERYVVVAVLTLLCPVGLAMGGSRSTKDICVGFIRTYASMIVMMVMNVLFLKLILSALSTIPSGTMVLPWCLLIVGIAKTARKADQLISRIGLNPASTGDPLGTGRGIMMAAMAARTILSTAGKGGSAKGSTGKTGGTQTNSSRYYGGNRSSNMRNATGGTNVGGNNMGGANVNGPNVGGNNMTMGAAYSSTADSNANSMKNSYSNNTAGGKNTSTPQSASTVRFGANSYNSSGNAVTANPVRTQFNSSGRSQINTNRFGSQPMQKGGTSGNSKSAPQPSAKTGTVPQNSTSAKGKQAEAITQNNSSAKNAPKTAKVSESPTAKQASKGAVKPVQKNAAHQASVNAKKSRFGGNQPTGSIRQNTNPIGNPKTSVPNTGGLRTTPSTVKNSVRPDNIEANDTAKEVLQDIPGTVISPKDGESDG